MFYKYYYYTVIDDEGKYYHGVCKTKLKYLDIIGILDYNKNQKDMNIVSIVYCQRIDFDSYWQLNKYYIGK